VIPDPFDLDPRLAADGPPVAELKLCHVRLVADARFFWLMLVPRRPGVTEIIDLSPADRALLMEEIATVSQVLKELSGCAKLNVAALGNVVPQLHVHIVARNLDDAAWPGPVFGAGTRAQMPFEMRHERVALLRARLR